MHRLLVLALLLFPLAAAADTEEEALQLQDRGIEAFERGEYPTAYEFFLAERRLVPDKPNPFRWLAMTEARLGECRKAKNTMTKFLGLVPPGDNRIQKVREEVGKCEQAPAFGVLAIDTDPDGAEIRIGDENGEPVGITPWRSERPAGNRVVHLRKAGFHPEKMLVTVEKEATAHVQVPLRPIVAVDPVPTYKKWWVWTVVGVVVAAAAGGIAAGVVLGTREEATFPKLVFP